MYSLCHAERVSNWAFKADILDAQHQTMSKFMIKEAEKREADQKMNMEKFEQLYSL